MRRMKVKWDNESRVLGDRSGGLIKREMDCYLSAHVLQGTQWEGYNQFKLHFWDEKDISDNLKSPYHKVVYFTQHIKNTDSWKTI